jgi:hypothetical protein
MVDIPASYPGGFRSQIGRKTCYPNCGVLVLYMYETNVPFLYIIIYDAVDDYTVSGCSESPLFNILTSVLIYRR